MLIAIIVIVGAAIFYVVLVRTNTVWLLNRLMLWGAGLGLVIFFLVSDIVRVAKHKGPGYVSYGEEDDVENVSETEYKRHHLVSNGFLLLLAILAWIEVAKRASPRKNNAKVNEVILDT